MYQQSKSRPIDLYYRAQRIVRDSYRADDVANLLIGLRDKAFGKETIVELGNFVAHSDRRTKRLIANESQIFFKTLRLSNYFDELEEKEAIFFHKDIINIALQNFVNYLSTTLRQASRA